MNRRTLLTRIVTGFSLVAAAGFSIPFLRSLIPAFRNEITLDIDVERLKVGEMKRVNWLGRPVYLVKRDLTVAGNLTETSDLLADPDSEKSSQPEYALNAYRSRRPEHLLVYANCTHLGCEVDLNAAGGFDCPCHQSEFDAAGRVKKGSAAKFNLEVPEYQYAGREVVRLVHIKGQVSS